MSRNYYSLDKEHTFTIRGMAKLLNVSSAKYGGDWHSVPHTHNHMELFYIVGGKGQFLIQDHLYPVNANNLVVINPNIPHTEVSLNAPGTNKCPVVALVYSGKIWYILSIFRY